MLGLQAPYGVRGHNASIDGGDFRFPNLRWRVECSLWAARHLQTVNGAVGISLPFTGPINSRDSSRYWWYFWSQSFKTPAERGRFLPARGAFE